MKTTPILRCLLVVLLASSCDRTADCTDCDEAKRTAATAKKIAPWETFNEGFNGCAGGCGMRVAGPTDGVIAQPGAMIGQSTYCPVSGVAFEIKATSAHRIVADKTFY